MTLDFRQPPHVFARTLIGADLTLDGVGGPIVESEAYEPHDPASHSFRGLTARNAVMFGEVGRIYVYRIYGMHWCINIVCGTQPGGAVLIRALEPRHGLDLMAERRGTMDERLLCSGPGKLCQALAVTHAQNGLSVLEPPFSLAAPHGEHDVACGVRIGLTKGVETPWRFGLAGSKYLSRRI